MAKMGPNATEKEMFVVAQRRRDLDGGFLKFNDVCASAYATAKNLSKGNVDELHLTTGFEGLDMLLGHRLLASRLVIVGTRCPITLSSIATNLAFNAAQACLSSHGEEKTAVAMFSLDLFAERHGARILSQQTQIPLSKIDNGQLTRDELVQLDQGYEELRSLPLFIDEFPGKSLSGIRDWSLRLAREHKICLFIIDRLQLVADLGVSGSEAIDPITALLSLAEELGITFLIFSDLTDAAEHRQDKRPIVSDLPNALSIEQYAGVVILLHREAHYIEHDKPFPRVDETADEYAERYKRWEGLCERLGSNVELMVARNSSGPTGSINLVFDKERSSYSGL